MKTPEQPPIVSGKIRPDSAKETMASTFSNGYALKVNHEEEKVEILSTQGQVVITIEMTEKGPQIQLEGAKLAVRASEELSLKSKHLHIEAEESLTLRSQGNLIQEVGKDLISQAEAQYLKASLGDVQIRANDDVRLDGERIKLNCDE